MERTDFWKEEGHEFDIGEDLSKLSAEQIAEYAKDYAKAMGEGESEFYLEFMFEMPKEVKEKYPEICIEATKYAKGIVSRIPKTILEEHPELMEAMTEEDWLKHIYNTWDFGNIPSDIIEKNRNDIQQAFDTVGCYQFEVEYMPYDTVKNNPWLLTEIIKHTRAEARYDTIDELPEEIKEQYGTTLQKACAIFGKIDELQAMREKARSLEREIDDVFRETIKEDQKRRIGEDEDGIR